MGANTQGKNILIREFSSGGVIFRHDKGKTLWFVRKTMANEMFPKSYWMLPKGWLDDSGEGIPGPMASGKIKPKEEDLQKAALREVAEEGGIEAKIINKIGTFTYFYSLPKRGRIMKFVTFYLMEWARDLPEGFDFETSEVAWLPFEEALERLSFDREKEVLEKAKVLPKK